MTEPFDLQPLVTQCPNCHTQFRVSEAQLQIANGKVRCGACLSVFQGVDNIVWEQDEQLGDDADDALDDLLDELEAEPEASEVDEPEVVADEESILGLGSAPMPTATPTPTPTATATDAAAEPKPAASQTLSTEDAAEALAAAVAATFSQPSKSDLETAADEAPVAPEPEQELEQAAESVPAASEDVETGKQPPPEPSLQQPPLAEVTAEPEPAPESEPETELEAEAAALAQQLAKPELELEPLPQAQPEPDANTDPAPKPPAAVQAAHARQQEPAKPGASAAAPKSVPPAKAPPAEPVEAAPDPFERLSANKSDELPTPGAERGWMLYAVTIGGVVLLLAQILIFRFDAWTQDPGLRPIYATLCPVFGCELPPLQALDQMSSRNLTVRTHPSVEGALMVDTVIVNAADFPQAFPVLELTFTDIDGNVVAGRRFEPAEYLAGELKNARNIASRTPVRIKLEIQDPGPKAVSYKMDFR